jgi:hypothetical protein
MEEKVQYQSEERLLDIREHLQSLENKLTTVEHQVRDSGANATILKTVCPKKLAKNFFKIFVVKPFRIILHEKKWR